MTCPFCGKEMTAGQLRSRGANFFLPKGESAPVLYTESALKKRNAVILPPSIFEIAVKSDDETWPEGFVCYECKKIILEY